MDVKRGRDPAGEGALRGPSRGGKRGRGAAPDGPTASETLYGLHAGLALIERRPRDVLAVTCAPEQRALVTASLLRVGLERTPLRVAEEGALAEQAASRHHEGLVLSVRPRRFLSVGELGELLVSRRGTAVALDRVRNPYNVGAILRTAAFFGVDALLLGAPAPHPALHPDAVRVAEGGAEHLGLARTTDLAATLRRLRERGVEGVAAESQEGQDAARFPFARPIVLVLGHEREGLSARVRTECTARIHIRGSGSLDSLNVSVAAGVLIGMLAGAAATGASAASARRSGPAHR